MTHRAAIFDVDGVLVDSYAAYRRLWMRWSLERHLDPEVVWAATHARRPVDTISSVAPHLAAEQEYQRLRELMTEEGDAFPLFPAVADTLTRLSSAMWGVVTSGRSETVRQRLRAAGAPEPEVLVDGSMVVNGKPSPEGYLLAARLLGVSPASCLVIEDAPAGVTAAAAAGMRVLALTTTHNESELAGADHMAATFASAAPQILGWIEG